jgi:hypothetical protein
MFAIAGLLHAAALTSSAQDAEANEHVEQEPTIEPIIESRQVRRARERREAKNGRIVPA